MLDARSKAIVPMANLPQIRLVLSNLRAAHFDVAESNVLIRALFLSGSVLAMMIAVAPSVIVSSWPLMAAVPEIALKVLPLSLDVSTVTVGAGDDLVFLVTGSNMFRVVFLDEELGVCVVHNSLNELFAG